MIEDLPRVYAAALPENVKATALVPTFPGGGESQPLKTDGLPAIHVSLPVRETVDRGLTLPKLFVPLPRCFTSGDYIPLAIGISCPSSPALAKLYATSITIQLVKKRKIWICRGRQISVRETHISTAIPSGRTECNRGEAYLSFRLEAGAAGRESTWAVDGALEVSVSLCQFMTLRCDSLFTELGV